MAPKDSAIRIRFVNPKTTTANAFRIRNKMPTSSTAMHGLFGIFDNDVCTFVHEVRYGNVVLHYKRQ